MPLTREGRFYLLFIFIIIYYMVGDYSNESALLSFIWVYNVDFQSLVKGSPFKTKSSCARELSIDRHSISSYLDSGKIFKHQWIFRSTPLESVPSGLNIVFLRLYGMP